MTGIVGQINEPLEKNLMKKMSLKLKYTSQEKTDFWEDDFFSIAKVSHNTKSNFNRPIFNEDKSMLIIMEGEVFDYEKEKKFLIEKGHNFKSNKCAEYCLHLFEEYGEKSLEKLNGSFLIIIYNLRKKEVHLINDRLSSKPLFYCEKNDKNFVFSNQMSSILQDPKIPRNLDKTSIFEFFTFKKILGNKTFYKDIKLLPAASILIYKNGKTKTSKYWDMKFQRKEYSKTDYVDELVKRIKKAIKIRTLENFRYGLLLSGGLDSRMILSAFPKKVNCFTFADFDNKEIKISRRIAKIKNDRHFFLKRRPDHYVDVIEKAVDIGDGRFSFDHAHGIGFFKEIKNECDILFHGAMLDVLFRNINFGEYEDIPKKIGENPNKSAIILGKSFLEKNPEKLFNKEYSKNFKKKIIQSLEKTLKKIKNNGAEKYKRVLDFFSFPNAYNQRSYLHILHNQAYIKERTIALDNHLIKLYLETPIEFRENSILFQKAITKINPSIGRVLDSNKSFFANIPNSLKKIIRIIQGKIGKNKFLSKQSLLNPSYSQQAWPNFAEMIRHNKKLREFISKTINDKNSLSPRIFNIKEINNIFNEHLKSKKNNTNFLFLLLTFGVWYKKYGPN